MTCLQTLHRKLSFVLKVFALGNTYFFTEISVSPTENTDLLLGRGPTLGILSCPGSKEHDRLDARLVFTSSSLWLL